MSERFISLRLFCQRLLEEYQIFLGWSIFWGLSVHCFYVFELGLANWSNVLENEITKCFLQFWVFRVHHIQRPPPPSSSPYRYFHGPMLAGELTFPNFWAAQTKVFNHGIDSGSALLGSIGLTFKQGFDAIQRNGEGSPAKGSAHKRGSQWRESIDLKGEPVPFWGLYIFPALWNHPPPKWRDFWIHRQTANLNLFRAIGEKAFPWKMLLVICIEASPAELFSKWKVCR